MRVEREHPVHRHECDAEAPENQAWPGQRGHLPMGLLRPEIEKPRKENPSGKVDRRPRQEERHVQIDLLVPEDFVGRHHLGVRPRVQVGDADHDGEKHQRHQRKGARRRLARPPDHHAPSASGEILQHQPGQRPYTQADDEQVGPQVRAVELEWRNEKTDGAQNRAGDSRGQGARAPPLQVVLKCHFPPPSCFRASGGTSLMEAFWLNCRART